MSFLLKEIFPEIHLPLKKYLEENGLQDLLNTVDGLEIRDRCHCNDEFCASLYTTCPRPDDKHYACSIDIETPEICFTIDTDMHNIFFIEILFQPAFRKKLLMRIP